MTFLLPQVNRDTNSFIAVVFDGFNFAATHRNALPETLRDIDLTIAGSGFSGVGKNVLREFLQGREGVGKT